MLDAVSGVWRFRTCATLTMTEVHFNLWNPDVSSLKPETKKAAPGLSLLRNWPGITRCTVNIKHGAGMSLRKLHV